MKKYLAEMVGTMVLVLMGCGAAVSLGCNPAEAETVVGTAMAFGLAVVAMAYTIGGISGCHINPAITLGVYLSGRMSGKDAVNYVIYQCIGGVIGAALLYLLTSAAGIVGTGANDLQAINDVQIISVWGWIGSRGDIYFCICVGSTGCYSQDQYSKCIGRTGNRLVAGAGTSGLYPLHGYLC